MENQIYLIDKETLLVSREYSSITEAEEDTLLSKEEIENSISNNLETEAGYFCYMNCKLLKNQHSRLSDRPVIQILPNMKPYKLHKSARAALLGTNKSASQSCLKYSLNGVSRGTSLGYYWKYADDLLWDIKRSCVAKIKNNIFFNGEVISYELTNNKESITVFTLREAKRICKFQALRDKQFLQNIIMQIPMNGFTVKVKSSTDFDSAKENYNKERSKGYKISPVIQKLIIKKDYDSTSEPFLIYSSIEEASLLNHLTCAEKALEKTQYKTSGGTIWERFKYNEIW